MTDATQPEPLWGKEQTCEFLDIGPWHLENLIRYRKIPFRKVGRLIRFVPAEVRAWVDDNKIDAV